MFHNTDRPIYRGGTLRAEQYTRIGWGSNSSDAGERENGGEKVIAHCCVLSDSFF